MPLDFVNKKKKKPAPNLNFGSMSLDEQLALAPGAPVLPAVPAQSWADIINADPLLPGAFGDISAEEAGDRSQTLAALRQALIRMGGAGLAGLAGKLGPDWADLLDAGTLQAAQAGDQAGTTLSAQLAKQHTDRLRAEEDVRAAKGMLSSGQTGYEIGEARQANTISNSNALDSLLQALQGGVGGFAGRQGERNARRAAERQAAADRALALGLTPHPGAPAQIVAPPTPPPMVAQLRRNAKRPIRRNIRVPDYY